MSMRPVLLFALLLCVSAQAQTLSVLETPTAPGSLAPRLAVLDPDHVVLTWLEPATQGHRLRYAVSDGAQVRVSGTIAEGDFFANWADTPGLAVGPEGAWYAHWLQRSGLGAYAYDVRVAVSADRGQSWSEGIRPHRDGTPTEHGFVSHWNDAHPGVGLVWLDGRNTAPAPEDAAGHAESHGGGPMTLRTARVLPDLALVDEVLLDDRVCDCCATASARTAEGAVVAYRNRDEHEVRDIQLVRETGDGWSAPVPVHADGWRIEGCPVNGPAAIARGQDVIVAWFTLGADGVPRVRLARSRDGGRRFAAPLSIDEGSAIGRVDLAWLEEGWVLSWLSQTTQGAVVRLAHFTSEGAPLAQRDLVSVDAARSSGFPRLAVLGDDAVLLAWTDRTDAGASRVRLGRVTLAD